MGLEPAARKDGGVARVAESRRWKAGRTKDSAPLDVWEAVGREREAWMVQFFRAQRRKVLFRSFFQILLKLGGRTQEHWTGSLGGTGT